MQMAALAVSSVSVVTKEALYHYTLKVGNGANSDSVSCNKKNDMTTNIELNEELVLEAVGKKH